MSAVQEAIPQIVWAESAAALAKAREWAERLSLELVDTPPVPSFCLVVREERVELRHIEEGSKTGGVFVDFTDTEKKLIFKSAKRRDQPLTRALGWTGSPFKIIDATGGLGKDAFLFASLECEVISIERSPLVFALLQDGYERALRDEWAGPIVKRVRFIQGDSTHLLHSFGDDIDVVYLDPMYPASKKAALPKKEMQVFRSLIRSDDDAAVLLDTALKVARKRVIVKRPIHAEALKTPVSHSFEGKMVRYDCYLRR